MSADGVPRAEACAGRWPHTTRRSTARRPDSYYEIQVQTDRRAPLPDDRWKRGPRPGRRA
ncbi:hypothetical protein [Streptomyces sp. SAI-218]|uniref:hypothetical protein n=1 Tax=Streptomyces sp. SAI-218 TaxID=3377736 RepID=UPI003C79E1B7